MSQKSLKQRSMKQMHHKIKQISVPFTILTIVYLFKKKNRFREDITISYKHLRKESNIVILRDIGVKQSAGIAGKPIKGKTTCLKPNWLELRTIYKIYSRLTFMNQFSKRGRRGRLI